MRSVQQACITSQIPLPQTSRIKLDQQYESGFKIESLKKHLDNGLSPTDMCYSSVNIVTCL